MAKYSIAIKASAQRELDAVEESLFVRIDAKILSLADNPRSTGCKKLHGYKNHWRLRAGDWRVVYVIGDARRIVTITRAAHRGEIYKQ